jgi:hypothetical protein
MIGPVRSESVNARGLRASAPAIRSGVAALESLGKTPDETAAVLRNTHYATRRPRDAARDRDGCVRDR